jgi:hypothetical protein
MIADTLRPVLADMSRPAAALREQCRRLLPTGAIAITAVAWAASGRA